MCARVTGLFRPGGHELVKGLARETRREGVRFGLEVAFYVMKLEGGNSAQALVKEMTGPFDLLSVAGEVVSEEDCIVFLLAILPDS